ncbi:MAG: N-acetylmuramoyl-L-alanine amidase [Nitrospirota bacterium]
MLWGIALTLLLFDPFLVNAQPISETGFIYAELTYKSYPNYTRIVLNAKKGSLKNLQITKEATEESRLFIEFPEAPVLIKPSSVRIEDGLIKTVEIIDKGKRRYLTINMAVSTYHFKNMILTEPERFVIDIFRTDPERKYPITFVIDPGHGGMDQGITWSNKFKEKDITLDIAFRLMTMLQKVQGINVILTRNKDIDLGVRERAAIANAGYPSVFISIHVSMVNGFRIYTSEGIESSTIIHKPKADIERHKQYLWKFQQERHLSRALILADDIRAHLSETFKDEMVLAKRLPLAVLNSVDAPAIMVELPALDDTKKWSSDLFRAKITLALMKGILKYHGNAQRAPASEYKKER